MMTSHADTHDLDKLKRWQKDLEADSPDSPAVYAIFLVSERDTVAHETFRIFRDSFEERGAGFAHLVIFGQHGVSETARRLGAELELAEDMLPTLALFGGDAEDGEYITMDLISLNRGSESEPEPKAAYWTSAMFWSYAIISGAYPGSASVVTNVLAAPTGGQPGSAVLDLEEALRWAETKMDESIKAGGPPELNRVLTKRLSDLGSAVLESLGK
jgi:hypothetical protein